MLIKDRFTVLASPLSRVRVGYQQWSEWIAKKDPRSFKLSHRGSFKSFEAAWRAFGEIIDKGGVLFAGHHGAITYGFSLWIGLLPLAKWCKTKAISVEIDDEPNCFCRFLAFQDQDTLLRKINLRRNSVEGWYFHEFGNRLAFEDKKKLSCKLRRKRFGREDIELFLSEVDAKLIDANTFADEHEFCLFQHGTDEDHRKHGFPVLPPAERERLLSFSCLHPQTKETKYRTQTPIGFFKSNLRKCPRHIASFFQPVGDWSKWAGIDPKEKTALSVGEVVCPCGSKFFGIVQSGPNLKTKACCVKCHRQALLYDLKFYPGATLVSEKSHPVRTRSISNGVGGVNILVGYEYPDEASEPSDDPDAVCWCIVWCRKAGGEIYEVLNHETT